MPAHLRLSLTKKHRAHLLLSKNKMHYSLSFSLFYTKQNINLTSPYGSFLCTGFNCLKAIEPQDSLLLTTKEFVVLIWMKSWIDLGSTQLFWIPDSWIENPVNPVA